VLFMRTRLGPADFAGTAAALVFFSVGLFSWGAQNILARGFYATRNTVIPAVVGTITTAVSIPFYLWLMRTMQHRGLALASSLGITAYTVVLFVLLARRTQNQEVGALAAFFAKVCTASVAVGLTCYELANWLTASFTLQRPLNALFILVTDSLAGGLLLLLLLKLFRVREVDAYLRRGVAMITRSEPTRS
jgi:putative peptidoglycan lipid II flippase